MIRLTASRAALLLAKATFRQMEGSDFMAYAGAADGTQIAEIDNWVILISPEDSEEGDRIDFYDTTKDAAYLLTVECLSAGEAYAPEEDAALKQAWDEA